MPKLSSISNTPAAGANGSAADGRWLLAERVAQSRYVAKSARLHDLMLYLSRRVIDEGTAEIHEQEVGRDVFGRAPDYDTSVDNIVRVHASTLRKRLEQYFAEEGRDEPVVIELPKGNYALAFHHRDALAPAAPLPEAVPALAPETEPRQRRPADLRFAVAAGLAVLFATTTAFFALRPGTAVAPAAPNLAPAAREFWSAVFAPRQAADIVLDDAALGLYQELDGHPITLSEYFDRSYLRRLAQSGAGSALDPQAASAITLKRQASYSSVNLIAPLSHAAQALNSAWTLHFARDYAFRDLKNAHAVLLGNSRSDPWIEPFENRVGLRWTFDRAASTYYPVDSWAPAEKAAQFQPTGEHSYGYASVALLPNLAGGDSVLILSATGGSASATAAAFLMDGERMAQLRASLPPRPQGRFPYFEALLRIPSRSRLANDVQIVIARTAR